MSGPNTDQSGQIVPRPPQQVAVQQKPGQKLAGLVMKMAPELVRALPKHVSADRMGRIVLTALRVNPQLGECTESSFLGCVLTASQLGLEVNTPLGHAYLIPFKNRGVLTCTLIIGYQGMIQLARNSGMVTSVYAYAVHEGDEFSYKLGLHPDVVHKPSESADREERPITHVYAVAHQKDGPPIFEVLTWAEVMLRRSRSRSKDSGPWVTDTKAMALKTGVRKLFRWLPKSAEMQRAVAVDASDDGSVRISQVQVFDPEVTAALEKQGLAVDEDRKSVV